jgi:hypothetical protein
MSHRFAGLPRGKPLRGARAVAIYIWDDQKRYRAAYGLNREEYGIAIVAGELLGFSNWIDHALANQAGDRKRRKKVTATLRI